MEIRTERLLLREFVPEDWRAVLAYQADPRYLVYNPWTERTEQDVQDFVQRFIKWAQEQPRRKHQLAIVLLEEGRLIGNCGIRMETAAANEAELGYEIEPACWGRGYATEAACAMVGFGFEQLYLHRVAAWCIAENTGSARVLEKLGMQLEGRLREHEWIKGRWHDALLYGMLDREWKASGAQHG